MPNSHCNFLTASNGSPPTFLATVGVGIAQPVGASHCKEGPSDFFFRGFPPLQSNHQFFKPGALKAKAALQLQNLGNWSNTKQL
jgi:hypothetical protein